jgi:hypothetical protein
MKGGGKLNKDAVDVPANGNTRQRKLCKWAESLQGHPAGRCKPTKSFRPTAEMRHFYRRGTENLWLDTCPLEL